MKERKGTNISKAVVVIFGALASAIAFLLSNVEGPLGQIMSSFMGAISGPMTGLFLLSIFFHRTTTKGAVAGTLLAFGLILWIIIGQNFGGVVKKAPYLPLGPTDQCSNATTESNLTTVATVRYSEMLNDTIFIFANNTTQPHQRLPVSENVSGLQVLYSISYMYFNLIAVIITLTAGVIVSLCTQPEIPMSVDKNCILPLTTLVPSCLKKRLFKKEERHIDLQETSELEEMVPNGHCQT